MKKSEMQTNHTKAMSNVTKYYNVHSKHKNADTRHTKSLVLGKWPKKDMKITEIQKQLFLTKI
jgi:hypothetical protein